MPQNILELTKEEIKKHMVIRLYQESSNWMIQCSRRIINHQLKSNIKVSLIQIGLVPTSSRPSIQIMHIFQQWFMEKSINYQLVQTTSIPFMYKGGSSHMFQRSSSFITTKVIYLDPRSTSILFSQRLFQLYM